ncbi:MAG: hypothetical protein V4642_12610 [Bacteroidota bacterium]
MISTIKFTQRFLLTILLTAAVIFAAGCDTNTNDPTPTGKTLTVGGKINSASKEGAVLTFSPSSEFFSARFYDGNVPFADLSGTKWQDRSIIARLTDNINFSDNLNDHKSPLDISQLALESGKTYTMMVFYTSATTDVNQQGTLVFTR